LRHPHTAPVLILRRRPGRGHPREFGPQACHEVMSTSAVTRGRSRSG
jgi:hypothetical protein